jgi:hypothetical protein
VSATVGSYSFVCNVLYARDPRETRIYCQHCSREYKNKHPSRINTAYVPLQVIFVPVDLDAYRQQPSPQNLSTPVSLYTALVESCWKLRHTQYSRSHGMMVFGSDRQIVLYCLCLSSSFRGESPFLGALAWPCLFGRSMSQFPTNDLYLVPTDFGAISRPMWCLQSNNFERETGPAVLSETCLHQILLRLVKRAAVLLSQSDKVTPRR